jgi:hypothetical protein
LAPPPNWLTNTGYLQEDSPASAGLFFAAGIGKNSILTGAGHGLIRYVFTTGAVGSYDFT